MPEYFSQLIQHAGIHISAAPRGDSHSRPMPSAVPADTPLPGTEASPAAVEDISREEVVDAPSVAAPVAGTTEPAPSVSHPVLVPPLSRATDAAEQGSRREINPRVETPLFSETPKDSTSQRDQHPERSIGQDAGRVNLKKPVSDSGQTITIHSHEYAQDVSEPETANPIEEIHTILESPAVPLPSAPAERPLGPVSGLSTPRTLKAKPIPVRPEGERAPEEIKSESMSDSKGSLPAANRLNSAPVYLQEVLAWVQETPAPDERPQAVSSRATPALENTSSPSSAPKLKSEAPMISEQDYTVSIGSIHLTVDAESPTPLSVKPEPRRPSRPPRTDLDFLRWHRHYLRIR